MSLSHDEAADALKDIRATERRSASAYGYHMSAPHLILWGVIWMIGYGAAAIRPAWANIWLLLCVVGGLGSAYIGYRMKGKATDSSFGWRFLASFVAYCAFVTAVFTILPPTRDAQVAAFFPIVIAFAYMLMGIWTRAARITFIGIVIGAATMFGFFYLAQWYAAWLAVIGGGALVAGGLWMRSV